MSASQSFKEWELHCIQIQKATATLIGESSEDKHARIKRLLGNYAEFFEYYFPHYAKSKCASFHINIAKKLLRDKDFKGILEWFRGAAKSTHATIGFPLFLKANRQLKVMLLVGENERKANRLLADIQAELMHNERYIHDFGEQYSRGNWEDGNFITKDDTAFFSIGIGQSPRGIKHHENRPALIVVDDVDTKKRSKNPRLVHEGVDWILEDLMGCFDTDPKAATRFLHVNNRIAKTSILAGMVIALGLAYHSIVNALDGKGQPSWPERHTVQYWQEFQKEIPYRSFQANYMNNPITLGKIFKEDWIQWKKLPPLREYDAIIAYGDLSYRATGDYKAFKVWGKIGKEFHCIKAFVRQCAITEIAIWLYDYYDSLPSDAVVQFYVEGSFMQADFVNDFDEEGNHRGYYVPIIADTRAKPDKFDRIEKDAAFYHRGMVYYNEEERDNNDMKTGIDQLLSFEKGSGAADDSPDADEGAIYLLNKAGASKAFPARLGKRKINSNY